ncbi:MAG TPA: hypothetical protein VKZ53_31975 [Candidatus Angelobacter sp.]|nr:hypothetical protein [Candidatus Angelobacter sp.]
MDRTRLFCLSIILVLLSLSVVSPAQVQIAVNFGPPALPIYEQPVCPGDAYIWTPGYWAWDDDAGDYYWVPGTWVPAPQVGYLWTPPWWEWREDRYFFHEGYWGPHVGFYGGIPYGFGYFGVGFVGGRWDHDRFFYNRAAANVVNVRNVYNETVVNNVTVNRVSFNGGPGGIAARPRPEEEMAARDRHIGPVNVQTQHWQAARGNPELRATANQGRPPIAATPRAAEFRGGGVVGAREAGGPYRQPENRREPGTVGANSRPGPAPAIHPRELPPVERQGSPNTGDPNRDQKYQKQLDQMYAKQEQERQKLQQKQDREHQQMEGRNPGEPQRQQLEQRHQQQTQQLQQRHVQQQQSIHEHQHPR